MTPQQFFNKTVNYIRKQGEPAVSKNGTCLYRAGKLRCAAGVHITT